MTYHDSCRARNAEGLQREVPSLKHIVIVPLDGSIAFDGEVLRPDPAWRDDYGKSNGYTLKGQIYASEATNAVSVSADTKAHGILHMSDAGIAGTIKTLALTGVTASKDMFDTTVWPEAYALAQQS